MKQIYSWGRNKFINSNFLEPDSKEEIKLLIKNNNSFLPFGNGRSYGDVCLNKQNLISTRKLKKILSFDKKNGIIEVESGLLVSDLLPIILRNNYFLPVTAGTKFVTVGGMVANNIHGKNIKYNYFSDHLISFKLFNSKGNLVDCNKYKNKKIYNLTIGGIGLTGIIYSVKFKLKKINSLYLEKKNLYFKNLTSFDDFEFSKSRYDYSVTWVDSFSKFNHIKGIHFLTKHRKDKKEKIKFYVKKKKVNFIHKYLFKIFNNYFLFRFVNYFFYLSHYFNIRKYTTLEKFFYIQDKYIDWNKIYGKKGMVEFHILVPKKFIIHFLNQFFLFCNDNKIFSNLIVLKRLKNKKKYINFSGDGVSVSADFSINKNFKKVKDFFISNQKKYKYIFYYAKDSIVSKKNLNFDKGFYDFKKKIKFLNKKNKIKSILSDRIGITK